MGRAKATGKGKKAAKKSVKGKNSSAKKRGSSKKTKKPADVIEARESISNLVVENADDIAESVIAVALTGSLPQAKYMFEVAGLYPATEETKAEPEEDSFAKSLLDRLNAAVTPKVVPDADGEGGDGGECEDEVAQSATDASRNAEDKCE